MHITYGTVVVVVICHSDVLPFGCGSSIHDEVTEGI